MEDKYLTIEESILFEPTQMVACPTCHVEVYPEQILNDELNAVCDFCANMSVGFYLAQLNNTFYAARAEWHANTHERVNCIVFYRPKCHDKPDAPRYTGAYCVAIYQQRTNAKYIAVEQTLDAVFCKLSELGCGATEWKEVDRDLHDHFIFVKDGVLLWRKSYGVQLEEGTFNHAPESYLDDLDKAIF